MIQENLDNVPCYKMEEKSVSSDNRIPGVTGRTVGTVLVLSHVSGESLWKPEGTVHGPTR